MTKVIVEKMGTKFECRPVQGMKWRCGNCLRGLLLPHVGEKCKVCWALVVEVVG